MMCQSETHAGQPSDHTHLSATLLRGMSTGSGVVSPSSASKAGRRTSGTYGLGHRAWCMVAVLDNWQRVPCRLANLYRVWPADPNDGLEALTRS